MAISDNKKDLLLGQSVAVTIKTIDDNFTTLFDNEADLETQIAGKEPKFTKNTAFNKDFSTTAPLMDGTASAGSATTVSRGDHKHPTDTSRLAVKPDGVNALLDSNNKIQSTYLPDTVLGQLFYKGTFDASTGTTGLIVQQGDYYICSTGGSKNPDGTAASSGYLVGDWAVYNGADGWGKVDNTDAVTMVNGQIGSIHTYKGAWSNGATYYSGDIVLHTDSCLYLYINATHSSGHAPTDTAYWKIFGKVYAVVTTSSDGLMSASDKGKLDTIARNAEVNQNAISNVKVGSTTVSAGSKTDTIEIKAGTNVTVAADATAKSVTISAKDTTYSPASSTADGLMSSSDKNKLDGIASGAEVNQNAFGKVKVGSTTLSSGIESDTVEFIAGANVTLTPNGSNKSVTITSKDTTYSPATESANGLMSAADKKKLNDIDSSLLGVTADDIGKVKDVTVDGVSVLDTTTGIAAITFSALKAGFVSISSSDSVWTDHIINGATYKAIRVEKTHTALGVFNSSKQQIVVQEAYDDNYLYLCVGTTAINCTLRVLNGTTATNSGGSSGKYLHSISVAGTGPTGGFGSVTYQVVNKTKTSYDKDNILTSFFYPGHKRACSGIFKVLDTILSGYSVEYDSHNNLLISAMGNNPTSYSIDMSKTVYIIDTVYEL